MRKLLIDTNVVLDIALNRKSFYPDAMSVFVLAEQNIITGYVSASAITDIFYIASKDLGKVGAREALKHLLHVFYPATVTGNDIYKALELGWDDFEDSVQFVVGEGFSIDYIVTRNPADFASGSIPTITPKQLMRIITDIGE